MSDNVNVNSDVIIDAEFVPKTIIAQKELPDVTIADAGKVATVSQEGKWTADDVPKELPAVTSDDNGADLRVINGAWAKDILTKGSEISDGSDAILTYCSYADFSGETPAISFDFQYHSGYTCDVSRFIDVSNLKVFLLLNGKLVAFKKPFNEVFDYHQNPSEPNAPYITRTGNISWSLVLKSAYASLLTASDIKKYDFAYFRFMSNIVIDDPVPTT